MKGAARAEENGPETQVFVLELVAEECDRVAVETRRGIFWSARQKEKKNTAETKQFRSDVVLKAFT